MTISICGQVINHNGAVFQRDHDGSMLSYAMPPDRYLRRQPAPIPLHFNHDKTWQIGSVDFLQRSRAMGLMLIGRIPDDSLGDMLDDGPWYLSDSTLAKPLDANRLYWSGRTIKEVSLVRASGNQNTSALVWSRHDIARDGGGQPHGMPLPWRSCWDDAHKALRGTRYRKAPDHLTIDDVDELAQADEWRTDPPAARRAAIELLEAELATRAEPDDFADAMVRRRTFATALTLS